MVVNQKDWPQSSNDSEIRSCHDQGQCCVHKHHEDAGDFDYSPGVSDERSKAHPA